jgi:hypothetical protein
VGIEEDDVVVIAGTNRLESEDSSATRMGCAHIVTGPVTWVLEL